jgi:putative membrane-bound dehydrogenase-like protein
LVAVVAAVCAARGPAQSPPRPEAKPAAADASPLTDGRFGRGLDARVASAIVPGHADLRTPPITASCWARLADKKSYNILVASETKYSALHWELFTVAGSGRLTAFFNGMSPDHVRSEVDICDDRWHHLAMVYEPGRVRLYVDANAVADQAITSKDRTGRFEDIAIGSLLEGGLRCAGVIDEVHIARGVHPPDKLPDEPPQVGKETVGLWRFDEFRNLLSRRVPGGLNDASLAARHAAPSYVVRPALEVPPRVMDSRLTIELLAKEPDIVTPIGIVVDERDRLLVLESNTHFPPKGYKRHPSDRILWVQDTNNDGRADKFTVFADGFTAAMHLTSHPDGSIYVVTRGAIIRLRDKNGDGVADERTTLVRLETTCTYPHNGLFSVAFDWPGRMYISMGENLGADFKLVGSDGSVVSGGGEGGNIFRATAEGGKVERIATGFWNPVQLHFDVFGRLFTVDNDPDSRPPCRLLHIVPGGDYGYRYRNGRAGLHPFTAWNGELPGTLPMVAGTGEAPSGLLTCEFAGWPEEHRGKMLVTSWGDYRIDLFTLERRGASFRADRQPLVVGGDDFRPVATAAGRNGDVYVTDWVDKSYEVHLKGRIWRLRPKDGRLPRQPLLHLHPYDDLLSSKSELASVFDADRRTRERAARQAEGKDKTRLVPLLAPWTHPRVQATVLGALASHTPAEGAEQLLERTYAALTGHESADVGDLAIDVLRLDNASLRKVATGDRTFGARFSLAAQANALSRLVLRPSDSNYFSLLGYLGSDDPFLQSAAREAIRRSPPTLALIDDFKLTNPAMQAGMLLARRGGDAVGVASAQHRLNKYLDLRDERVRFIATQWIGEARLAGHREALLAALNRRDQSPQMFAATLTALALVDGAMLSEANAGGGVYLERFLADTTSSPTLKARSLRRVPSDSKAISLERLQTWLSADDAALRLEAVRSLRSLPDQRRFDVLATLVADRAKPATLRAEAVVGLADDPRESTRRLLMGVAATGDAVVRQEALRSLRAHSLTVADSDVLRGLPSEPAIAPLVQRLLEPEKSESRPAAQATDRWLDLLEGPADAAAGERIFYHTKSAGCYRCHRVDGRGSDVGPDLSVTPRTMDRRKLVESILQPSKEIAPQFFVWQVQTEDGRTFTGTLVGEGPGGEQTYADAEGKLITVRREDIAQKAAQHRSIMPDDLAKALTLQEFRDLLAFLTGAPERKEPAP